MVTVLGALLALSAAFFVGYPLLQKETEVDGTGRSEERQRALRALARKKEEAYRAIKEMDLDYQMGKLSLEDYQELTQRYKDEALELLKEMDQAGADDGAIPEIEQEIERQVLAARRKKPASPRATSARPTVNFCPQCGSRAQTGDKFCAHCGGALARGEE